MGRLTTTHITDGYGFSATVRAPATPDGWVWDIRGGVEGWWEDDEASFPQGGLTLAEEAAIRERDERLYWARLRGEVSDPDEPSSPRAEIGLGGGLG